jgi:small subunit ribosomal protein S2
MGEYIYGDRNGIHIIDLTQTVPMLDAALNIVRETVAKGGRILFVGTKRQAQKPIAEAADKCAQFYMNHRWLGGTLTNWKTVSQSIQRLKQLDELMGHGAEGMTKKERLNMEREQSKLQASLGGIREMGGTPDLIFIIDVGKEDLAILEAQKLGIPVIGVVDTNCSPKGVDYVIPGNDDALRAIRLVAGAVADVLQKAGAEYSKVAAELARKRGMKITNSDGTGITDESTLELAIDAAIRLTNGIMEGLSAVDLRAAYANAIIAHQHTFTFKRFCRFFGHL